MEDEVIAALEPFAELEDVEIQYSWDKTGDEREEFVKQEDDGFWAKNRVIINLDRKEESTLCRNYESVEIDSDFDMENRSHSY